MDKMKCQVHLVKTESSTQLYFHKKDLVYTELFSVNENDGDSDIKPQFLYITSDEEIKHGDWFCNLALSKFPHIDPFPFQRRESGDLTQINSNESIRKVIASTNPELWVRTPIEGMNGHFNNYPLPSIPKSFIKKYCDNYKLNNIINEVELEMVDETKYHKPSDKKRCGHYKTGNKTPKLDDNSYVTILEEEKIYSKTEVINILSKYLNEMRVSLNLTHASASINVTPPQLWFDVKSNNNQL